MIYCDECGRELPESYLLELDEILRERPSIVLKNPLCESCLNAMYKLWKQVTTGPVH